MDAAIIFAIAGWGIAAFLLIRLLLEVDMRDQLQEDIHSASILAQKIAADSEDLRERFDRESV